MESQAHGEEKSKNSVNGDPDFSAKESSGTGKTTASEEGDPAVAPRTTALRKALILTVLCSAQFWDIMNASNAIIALPTLGADLHFSAGSVQWVISAYTLTFAAFMLASGRLADIFHPKPVFCAGFATVGLLSIPIAASVHPIMTIVFRAVQGIGAAMNIPTAISMIVTLFPDPAEQGRALALYGAFGAIANVLGFIIGGVLTAEVSWRWPFYLTAIVVIPTAVASYFILPEYKLPPSSERRSVDWPGVSTLTAALILFVYALSDGSASGWGSARIVSTLVISIILFIGFFLIERHVKDPAIPPSTWTNKNFTPLFIYAWSIYWYILASQLQLVQIFTELWHTSTISAAVRFVPTGVTGGIATFIAGYFAPKVPRRIYLLTGQVLLAVGSILFALADTEDKYWSHVFPGMILGTSGLGVAYVACSIAVMEGARKGEEGVVGAIMFTAYQLGATIGIAITSSIAISINRRQPLDAISQHLGYEASFWSILGMHGVIILITLIFFRS